MLQSCQTYVYIEALKSHAIQLNYLSQSNYAEIMGGDYMVWNYIFQGKLDVVFLEHQVDDKHQVL